jgi:hypothetical protein
MSKKVNQDVIQRLFCERIVETTWSNAEKFKEELAIIVNRGTIKTDRDLSILLISAGAFLQRVTLSDADNVELGLTVVSCDKKNSCDDYELADCDLI